MKCVMIIDENLPLGLIANTAAVLGISLAGSTTGLIGRELKDSNGRIHHGITNLPVPVLGQNKEGIKKTYDGLLELNDPELKLIGFNETAQKSLDYEDYGIKLKNMDAADINLLGICIAGSKKKVNKLTGNLRILR